MKTENSLMEWIAEYDNGNVVESVQMGGISEGYESAIQDCAIEIMRALQMITIPEDKKEFSNVVNIAAESAVTLLDKRHGFSGAQVGAAKNIASVFWRQSPEKGLQMMKEQDPQRIIKIRRDENGSVNIVNS